MYDVFRNKMFFIKYVYYKRVRAGLVRRLIWVEEYLCSNHNNPIYDLKKLYINI